MFLILDYDLHKQLWPEAKIFNSNEQSYAPIPVFSTQLKWSNFRGVKHPYSSISEIFTCSLGPKSMQCLGR